MLLISANATLNCYDSACVVSLIDIKLVTSVLIHVAFSSYLPNTSAKSYLQGAIESCGV